MLHCNNKTRKVKNNTKQRVSMAHRGQRERERKLQDLRHELEQPGRSSKVYWVLGQRFIFRGVARFIGDLLPPTYLPIWGRYLHTTSSSSSSLQPPQPSSYNTITILLLSPSPFCYTHNYPHTKHMSTFTRHTPSHSYYTKHQLPSTQTTTLSHIHCCPSVIHKHHQPSPSWHTHFQSSIKKYHFPAKHLCSPCYINYTSLLTYKITPIVPHHHHHHPPAVHHMTLLLHIPLTFTHHHSYRILQSSYHTDTHIHLPHYNYHHYHPDRE